MALYQCAFCQGKGEGGLCLLHYADGRGRIVERVRCPDCDGTGKWTKDRLDRYEAGQRHRAERIERGESQREAASRLGITLGQLTALECGRLPSPDEERR